MKNLEKHAESRKSIFVDSFGGPEVLKLKEEPLPLVQENEVLIDVKAAGVNFADLLMRMGLYPEAPKPPFIPGYELAGVVRSVGSAVSRFKEGDRVFAGTRFGGYTSAISLPESGVFPIPGNLTFEEAASIPVNYITAWIALNEMGRIRAGDRVLVPSAAGGVGLAAVQMAHHAGAEVVGLVSSSTKFERVKQMGATEVWKYDDWNRKDRTQASSQFDIILDSQGGKNLKRSYASLTPAGRVITYGISTVMQGEKRSWLKIAKLATETPVYLPYRLMNDNRGVFGLNVLPLFGTDLLARSLSRVLSGFQKGEYQVTVGKTFPLKEAQLAHQHLMSRKNVGKVILINDDSQQ